MEWSREKDTTLAKEVLYSEPFQYKERTAQNVQAWQDVIAKVKTNYPKKFKRLTQRGAKEHMSLLLKNLKKKNMVELRASGISPEVSELDKLLEEISEKMDFYAAQNEKENEKKKKEEAAAKDVRLRAMETLRETKKRGEVEKGGKSPKQKRPRSNGSEMVAFLRDRANEELASREKAEKARQLQMEQEAKRHDDLLKHLAGQQQEAINQQQQQFAQMQQMMANQQQQNFQLLMAILQKKN